MILEFRKKIPDREINFTMKKQIAEAFLLLNDPKSKAQLFHTTKVPIIRTD